MRGVSLALIPCWLLNNLSLPSVRCGSNLKRSSFSPSLNLAAGPSCENFLGCAFDDTTSDWETRRFLEEEIYFTS
jgi:hypothetical protein